MLVQLLIFLHSRSAICFLAGVRVGSDGGILAWVHVESRAELVYYLFLCPCRGSCWGRCRNPCRGSFLRQVQDSLISYCVFPGFMLGRVQDSLVSFMGSCRHSCLAGLFGQFYVSLQGFMLGRVQDTLVGLSTPTSSDYDEQSFSASSSMSGQTPERKNLDVILSCFSMTY